MRIVASVLAGLVLATILLDPYTFHQSASDHIVQAAWWQTTLGLIDAALLVVGIVLLWRRRSEWAFNMLAGELLYALSLGIVFVERDGVGRFVRGFAAEQYLTVYFVALGLRVALLWIVQRQAGGSREAAA